METAAFLTATDLRALLAWCEAHHLHVPANLQGLAAQPGESAALVAKASQHAIYIVAPPVIAMAVETSSENVSL